MTCHYFKAQDLYMEKRESKFKATSKTEQVCAHIEGLIGDGSLRRGDRILPENKLAECLGVSVVTVKRGMEELVKRGLVYKVQGKGTFVAERVSGKWQESDTFNLIYPAAPIAVTCDPFLGPLIDGIESSFSKYGCNLRLMPLRDGRSLDDLLKEPSNRKSASSGSILVNYQLSRKDSEAVINLGLPLVSVGKQGKCDAMPYVDVDHHDGGKVAAMHLITHGRRCLAFIGGKKLAQPYCSEIISGIREACEASDITWTPDMISYIDEKAELDERANETAKAALALLDGGSLFDAVIVFGSESSKFVLNALKGRNLRIPEDVSLISYTDFTPVTRATEPQITAIRQPNEELGVNAARLLLKLRRTGPHGECHSMTLGTELIPRGSCGCV